LASLLAPASAQRLDAGYQASARSLTSGDAQVTVVSEGRVIFFDGQQLILDDGVRQNVLLSFPSPVFGSFTVQVSPTEVLFGESSNQGIWKVPFAGSGQPVMLANITFNYDAVPFGDNHAIVSAKTGGFAANDNDLIAVDLTTGQTDLVAVIPGASGPLAADAAGNVYYATSSNSFPPPAGSVEILRFDRSTVETALGSAVLAVGNARVLYQGLDAASSMAIDDDGDIFITDYTNNHLVELSDINSGLPSRASLVDYAGVTAGPSSVMFVRTGIGHEAAEFEPFQASMAGALVIHESAWAGVSQLRYVTPRRPVTMVSADPVPSGAFAIQTSGGPTRATGALVIGVGAGIEQALQVGGFEQPLLFGLSGSMVFVNAPFDALGVSLVPLVNPGMGGPLQLSAQSVFMVPSTGLIGSGPVRAITLQ